MKLLIASFAAVTAAFFSVATATSTIEVDLVGVSSAMTTADQVVAFTASILAAFNSTADSPEVTVASLESQEFHEGGAGTRRRRLGWRSYHHYSSNWSGMGVKIDGTCNLCPPNRRVLEDLEEEQTAFEETLCHIITSIPDPYFEAIEECHVFSTLPE